MNKEFKFRAWHIRAEKFAFWGTLLDFFKGNEIAVSEKMSVNSGRLGFGPDGDMRTYHYNSRYTDIFTSPDWIVEQYSLVNDDHDNTEIYDGDVLLYDEFARSDPQQNVRTIVKLPGFYLRLSGMINKRVIGNIHQDPKLSSNTN